MYLLSTLLGRPTDPPVLFPLDGIPKLLLANDNAELRCAATARVDEARMTGCCPGTTPTKAPCVTNDPMLVSDDATFADWVEDALAEPDDDATKTDPPVDNTEDIKVVDNGTPDPDDSCPDSKLALRLAAPTASEEEISFGEPHRPCIMTDACRAAPGGPVALELKRFDMALNASVRKFLRCETASSELSRLPDKLNKDNKDATVAEATFMLPVNAARAKLDKAESAA